MNGSVLGERYRIEARLGAGGMAEVFRGFDPVLNRTVAIKVLLPQFARDAGFVARFRREAQAAARLNDPSIVGVFDTGADGETQYIVMEFVEGRTLQDALGSGRRPTVTQAVELAERIGEALAVAHAQGIVHRDIKPANVMVTRDGKVKVMDFGIARIQTVETAPQTSSVLGTPTYLSPEQAQGQPVDARSDLYSLGVVLYEMLAGQPPFTGDSPVAIAYKQVNEAPKPPSLHEPDVSPRLDAVVMKALSKNPANRYQTAEEFTADLERVKKGQDVEATPLMPIAGDATQVIARPQATQVMPPPEAPPGSSRKVWLGVLIGILVVAVLGGGGYLLATSLKGNDTQVFALDSYKGQTLEQATSALEALGLVVQDPPPTQQTDNVAPNTVVKQDPPAGTQVKTGDTIVLTIAVPIPKVKVPDISTGCLSVSEAQAQLQAKHLDIGNKAEATSDQCQTGDVIDQSPAAGQQVPQGTLVDVTIVSGPASVTLADYTCLPYGKAASELSKLGLNATFGGTAPVLSQCPNTNRVAMQDPPAGTSVAVGSTVTLYTGEEASPTVSPSASGSPSP